MSIHQQVNPNTVDSSQLPDHLTAGKVMSKISALIWDAQQEPQARWYYHDYWVNSTPRRGVRAIRVRCNPTPETLAVMPKVQELLAPYDGMCKTYPYGRVRYEDSNNDPRWVKYQITCIVLYYRSWQAGELRRITQCDPGHELTLLPGQRVTYAYNDLVRDEGNWHMKPATRPATIVKRVTHNQFHPYYLLKFDTPFNENNDYSPAGYPDRLTVITE